ncbi:MAG: hypothetical protein PHI68_03795 [Candidatus Cloacimonetes bacterium]|nr:hypothetical protein [Candidatus Cloacimonadota bacterium]
MNKIALTIALCVFISLVNAAIWHVNNNSAMNADFTSLQDANNDAGVASGDTIYVYGSVQSYGEVNINKQLTILGTGYFLANNPGFQHQSLEAVIGTMSLNEGSSGSLVAGLTINDNINLNTTSLTIEGCRLLKVRVNSSNCIIQGCYVMIIGGYNSSTVILSNAMNTIISNTLISANNGFYGLAVASNSSATVCNCIIRSPVNIYNTDFYNNILYKDSNYAISLNTNNSNVHHNVFQAATGTDWSSISDPTNIVDWAGELFTLSSSPDGKFELLDSPDNPALSAGIFGQACGIFGGLSPYRLSGIPRIPSIYEFLIPSTGNVVPIRVRAKTNN